MTLNHRFLRFGVLASLLTCLVVAAVAQQGERRRASKDNPDDADDSATVIKRQPLILEDPRTYRIPLRLAPARSIALTAPVDGIIRDVEVKRGDNLPTQGDVVRLDQTRAEFHVRRAKALVEARQIELKLAEQKAAADEVALAKAKLEAAKAELDLQQYDMEKMVVRGPFAGVILSVFVVPGQFVRAGEPVAQLGDLTSLTANVPVDRTRVRLGQSMDITIETDVAKATVDSVLPAPSEYDALRELANSLAMATIRIPNRNNQFQPGQAVYVELIPVKPVAVVPSIALSNQEEGRRKVQVVRDFTVRDVTIDPLAQIGSERIYVSGDFSAGDEVIVSSSSELTDGTLLRPWTKEVDDPADEKPAAKNKRDRGL